MQKCDEKCVIKSTCLEAKKYNQGYSSKVTNAIKLSGLPYNVINDTSLYETA